MARYSRKSAIFLAAMIAFFSLLPAETAVSSGIGDKTEHFAAFVLLAFMTARGWLNWSLLKVAGICILFGGAIEVAQHFSPGRYPDPLDWLADTIGVALGILAAAILTRAGRPGSSPPPDR